MTATLEAVKFLRCFEHIEVQIQDGAWSGRRGIRYPFKQGLYPEHEIVEDVTDWLFSKHCWGKREGVTVVRVKEHIRYSRWD